MLGLLGNEQHDNEISKRLAGSGDGSRESECEGMESSAFSRVFAAANQVKDMETAAKQEAEALREQILVMRDEAINTQFKTVLEGIGIHTAFSEARITIEGITIAWKPNGAGSYPQYYPLELKSKERNAKPALDNMVMDDYLRGELMISSDLDEAYRWRSDSQSNWQRTIKLNRSAEEVDWLGLAANVGNMIAELQREKDEAPAKKEAREAKYQQQRDEERARVEAAAAAFKADREARDQQQKVWDAENAARREREVQLRAEVAEKFGISGEAFEYLIECLADEMQRRNRGEYYE